MTALWSMFRATAAYRNGAPGNAPHYRVYARMPVGPDAVRN